MATDLAELTDLWRKRFPSRARGAQDSLLGYRFQLLVGLRDAVRAFVELPDQDPSVFIERISDVCQLAPSGEILFTQVKITGRTVASALEDLWSIHVLISEEKPALMSRVRYRILCSRWILQDAGSAIERWHPSSGDDPTRIQLFKERVSTTTDPNPLDDLLSAVANSLEPDDPLSTIHSWIGLLTDVENGARSIWSELNTLMNRKLRSSHKRPYFWSSEDRPPPTITHGDILTSEQPKVQHLRLGYFASRPVYEDLKNDAIRWLRSGPGEHDSGLRAPVLWIGGRSGCGKSVALLHVLSKIFEEGIGPILWLGNRISLLPDAIRSCRGIAGPSDQVLIAVDDPYSPRTRGDANIWREALAEIDQMQNQGNARKPIIICCGPSSQANQLREDFADEVKIHTLTVPYTLDDRDALISWYEERTGERPTDVGKGDLLLVQLFFEWLAGEQLSSFARRFRERIEEKDPSGAMRDVIYRIVAANRLYAGYPREGLEGRLSPDQRDEFEVLVKEHHFAIDEDSERRGIWLTHPHLANGLFESWLPDASRRFARIDVLKETILDGLRYGSTPVDQTTFLWALANLTRADEPARERLQPGLQTYIPDVYAEWLRQTGGSLTTGHISAWIELAFAVPALRLDPDPVKEMLDRLQPDRTEETGFHRGCQRLLQRWDELAPQMREEAERRIVNLLSHSRQWRGWPFVAVEAILRIDNSELRQIVKTWFLSNNTVVASNALSALLYRFVLGPNHEFLLNLAAQWIEKNLHDIKVGIVLSLLLKRRDLGSRATPICTVALQWMQQFTRAPEIEPVLRRLLTLPSSPKVAARAVRLALEYVESTGLKEGSSFMLAATLRARVLISIAYERTGKELLSKRAIRVGMDWLANFSNEPNAPYVADRLLRAREVGDEEWTQLASRSLARIFADPWARDVDYSLLTIAQRRRLLDDENEKLFSSLIRQWFENARKNVSELNAKRKYLSASKYIAPALPLAMHAGDLALQEEFEGYARNILVNADENARKAFEQSARSLIRAHSWPSKQQALDSLRRVGMLQKDGLIFGQLLRLIHNKVREADPPPEETINFALARAEIALNEKNFRLAGYLVAKLLPLTHRLEMEEIASSEMLAQKLVSASSPVEVRCGFILECQGWVDAGVWPSHETAYSSFELAGFQTPRMLRLWISRKRDPSADDLRRNLAFVEELLKALTPRAGLFLGALLLLTLRINDSELKEGCEKAIRTFVDSNTVSEGLKSGFARKVKELSKFYSSNDIRPIMESLDLQDPWLAEDARTGLVLSAAVLNKSLDQIEKLVDKGRPQRAGNLLAPMFSLIGRARESGLLDKACALGQRILADKKLFPEDRHGFGAASRSFPWPDDDTRDRVLQMLGADSN